MDHKQKNIVVRMTDEVFVICPFFRVAKGGGLEWQFNLPFYPGSFTSGDICLTLPNLQHFPRADGKKRRFSGRVLTLQEHPWTHGSADTPAGRQRPFVIPGVSRTYPPAFPAPDLFIHPQGTGDVA